MPNWNELIREYLGALRLAPAREAEIAEELAQHAEDRYGELRAAGVSEGEARKAVLEELTGHELLGNRLRSVEQVDTPEPLVVGSAGKERLLASLMQDLRYGFRTLRKSPGFTAVAVLALAIGIGANTAIFSVINGVLLQPLAFPEPDRLVRIVEATADSGATSVAYPNYLDWRRDNQSFTDMGAYTSKAFNFTGDGQPQQLSGEFVTASLFPVLGVTPYLGRNFRPEEDRQNAACTVILSYGFWQSRFGGDRNVLEKKLTLNSMSCSVIGVMRSDLRFAEDKQVFVPIEIWDAVELRARDSHPGLQVVGRLKPGITAQVAQLEMAALCKDLARLYPETNGSHTAKVHFVKEDMVRDIRPTLFLLMGAVAFVLVIACANVANLLLARSTGRRREFAIRAALGAKRSRVVRQLLTESVLLSMAGAVLGLLLARWGTSAVSAMAPGILPRSGEIGIDAYVVIFTLAVSVVTGILFGLAPAFQGTNTSPQQGLKEGTRGAGGGRHRTEGVFVALETGLAVVLLAGAGLTIQSLWRIMQVDLGFNAHNVLSMKVALSPKVMGSPQGIRLAFEQMLARVGATPGIQSAAMTTMVPMGDQDSEIAFWKGNGPQPPQERLSGAMLYIVTPDYPKVMQLPLLSGRLFTDRDRVGSSQVVVIDEAMAKHLFPGQSPIGQQISLVVMGPVQIIGVVGHAKQWGPDGDGTNIRDHIYFPFLQIPDRFMSEGATGLTLVVRTTPEPLSMVQALRAQVAGPTLDQPIYDVKTMEETVAGHLRLRRFTMTVLILFAAVALLLAAVGIYGVMSYAVTRRVNEFGIRAALGASRSEILALMLRQGMTLVGIGLLGGLAAAVGLTRLMAGSLYGVQPSDPLTLLGVTVLLGGIALVACYIPARRATAVDPVVALRCE